MDGENNGKPYEQMDDLGVPLLLETATHSCFARKLATLLDFRASQDVVARVADEDKSSDPKVQVTVLSDC